MAFRLLNQISSIKHLTNGTFRSASADRSISKLNENAITTIHNENWILNLSKRRSQSQPCSARRFSSRSRDEDDQSSKSPYLVQGESDLIRSKYVNPFATSNATKRYKMVLNNMTQYAEQEYMKAMKKFSRMSAAGIKLGYTLESAQRGHRTEKNVEDLRKEHLMNYTRIKSNLQPNNLAKFGSNPDHEYRLELTKSSKTTIEKSTAPPMKRDFYTYVTEPKQDDIKVEDLQVTDIDETPIEMNTKELMEWINSSANKVTKRTTNSFVKKGFLSSKPVNSNQSRHSSTFYGEIDPDCPPPPKKKHEQPPKVCQVELVDNRPRIDCKQPPPKKPPPLIPIPRIPKIPIRPPPRVCVKPDQCPERADKDLKIQMKTLPCLPAGNCKCKEPLPLNEGCPFPRLKKKIIDQPAEICKKPDPCPPRADANYKIKMKELPLLIPGDCPCVPFEMKDVPPLPRLIPKPVPPPPERVCDVDKCPPRADAGLVVKKKRLRPLRPNPCPCVEPPPLKEGCPLPRLKASKVCERPNEVCPGVVECPDRADDLCEYKVKEKTLPTMILCKNEISTWEYNSHKRKFSTLSSYHVLLNPPTPFLMTRYHMSTVCDANIPRGTEERKKPCKCIEPFIPNFSPKLRKLVKRYDTNAERNYNIESSCKPPIFCPPRADESLDLYVRKSLPFMKPSNCPKIAKKQPVRNICLKRPKKLFQYTDPVRTVHVCGKRSDDEYVFKRKKLPKLKVSSCKCIEPYMPTYKPKMRRLEKKYDTNEPRRCLNSPACGPPICYRADDAIDLYPKKILPTLKCNKCPKHEHSAKSSHAPVKRLVKRFEYHDPKRICPEIHCPPRADDTCKYEIKRKTLRPLLPCSKYPLLPNFMNQNRSFHTTAINEKKKTASKKQSCKISSEPKSECKKVNVSNCPPRARQHCREKYHYKDCSKQNSPYKSFAECSDYELPTLITECEKSKYLQPRFPQIPEILAIPPPPPKYAPIDPKFEEMCVYKKMCMINKGHTKNCSNFYEVKPPLRQKDVEDSERVSCNPEEIKCPVVSYEICEQDTCPPKGGSNQGSKELEAELKRQLEAKECECQRLAQEKEQLEADYQAQCQKFAEEMHVLECEKQAKEKEEMECRLKNEEKERQLRDLSEAKKREELMCKKLEEENKQSEVMQKKAKEEECKQQKCEQKMKDKEQCQRQNQELECPRRMPDQCRKKKEEKLVCPEKPKCLPKRGSSSSSKGKPPCPSPCDTLKPQKAGKATNSNRVNDCKKAGPSKSSCKIKSKPCGPQKKECPPVGDLLRYPPVHIPNEEKEIPLDPEIKRCLAELNKKMQSKKGGCCPKPRKCGISSERKSPCKSSSKTTNVVKFSTNKRSSDSCRDKQKKDPCHGKKKECPSVAEYLRQPPVAIPVIDEKTFCDPSNKVPSTGCPPIGDLLRHPPVNIPAGDERPEPVDCDRKKCLSEYNRQIKKKDDCKPKKPQCKVKFKCPSTPNVKCKISSSCKPKQEVCPRGVPKSLWQRILDYFKPRANCPQPGDWKRKELKLQAEKAAKAAGLCVCEPQPKKCSSAPTITCKKTPSGNAACQPPPSRCPPAPSKCSYATKASTSDGGKKCKVSPVECKDAPDKNAKITKKPKQDEKFEEKQRCGSTKTSCKKESSGDCKLNPMHNCPPGKVRPCKGKPIHKDCCYVEAPYASYTDLNTTFKRLNVSECSEQAMRVYVNRDKRVKPQEKKKKGKCDDTKRSFSTYIQSRCYSSRPRNLDPFYMLDPNYQNNTEKCDSLKQFLDSLKRRSKDNPNEVYYNLLNFLSNMEVSECDDSTISYKNQYSLTPEYVNEDNNYLEAVKAFCKTASKPKLGMSYEEYEAMEVKKTKALQQELDEFLENSK